MALTRRQLLSLVGSLLLTVICTRQAWTQTASRVVVVGGGLGGATCAKYLRRADATLDPAARRVTLDNGKGWCRVPARAFESTVHAGIHLIGDAIIASSMPQSAFSANTQAKVCAAAIVALLRRILERYRDRPILTAQQTPGERSSPCVEWNRLLYRGIA